MDLTTAYTDTSHRQPGLARRAHGHPPTNEQWVVVAAVWLLAIWSPEEASGWASALVPGRTKAREDQQWPEPPPLPELAAVGAFAPTVTGATVLTSRVSPGPGRPYEPARADDEVAAELATLISDVVAVGGRRAEALVRFLGDRLAGPHSDVLRLTTSAESSGLPTPLHLLHRDARGSTLRVSLSPAPTVQRPVFPGDGPDGPLRTRFACVMTLLSDLLWVSNNNPVTFRFGTGKPDQAASDEEFRAISATELRAGLRNLARLCLVDPLLDDLAAFLIDDLVDLVLAHTGDDVQVTCAGFLPVTWPPEDEEEPEEYATVLLVAGAEVAVLEIDLSS